MKEEIKVAEEAALKIIDETNWDPAKKMFYNKIITDTAWSTNGSQDKLQDLTESTFKLAYMDVVRDKEIDELKNIVKSTQETVDKTDKNVNTMSEKIDKTNEKLDELSNRMDTNDKITIELKRTFDSIKNRKPTKMEQLFAGLANLGWKGIIWVWVPLAAIMAMVYKSELIAFFTNIF